MEQTFQIPARPWGEAEVKYLADNVDLLDEETKAELGFLPVAPINDFKANTDAALDEGPAPVVETGTIEPTGVVTVDGAPITPEDVAAGLEAFNALPLEDQEAARAAVAGLPTDAEGAVVDNQGTDNA